MESMFTHIFLIPLIYFCQLFDLNSRSLSSQRSGWMGWSFPTTADGLVIPLFMYPVPLTRMMCSTGELLLFWECAQTAVLNIPRTVYLKHTQHSFLGIRISAHHLKHVVQLYQLRTPISTKTEFSQAFHRNEEPSL